MLIKASGNLITLAKEGWFDVIAHGCNCVHIMGAGIAAQVADEFPEAYKADQETEADIAKIGTSSAAHIPVGDHNHILTVENWYTQTYPGGGHFSNDALELLLQQARFSWRNTNLRVGLPYIGCGIAGGNESLIVSMFEHYLKDCNVMLVRYQK